MADLLELILALSHHIRVLWNHFNEASPAQKYAGLASILRMLEPSKEVLNTTIWGGKMAFDVGDTRCANTFTFEIGLQLW